MTNKLWSMHKVTRVTKTQAVISRITQEGEEEWFKVTRDHVGGFYRHIGNSKRTYTKGTSKTIVEFARQSAVRNLNAQRWDDLPSEIIFQFDNILREHGWSQIQQQLKSKQNEKQDS